MKDAKNILMVHNYYQIPGGEDTVVSNELKLLKDNGHQVWVYNRNNSEISGMNFWQKIVLPFLTIFNIKTYLDIKRLIAEKNIDVVHVHNTLSMVSPAVYYAAKNAHVPIVQTIHNFRLLCPAATLYRDNSICEDCINKGLMCAVKHKCYRGSLVQTGVCVISTLIHRMTRIYSYNHYICLTEFNKRKLLQLSQISEDRVFVKPNFVDTDGLQICTNRNLKQYIYAGRLDILKGIKQLFEAWSIIERDYPELGLTLLVCGTGPMENWCQNFIRENKLKSIKMVGFIRNEKVKLEISKSKALLLPTQWYEGFPMTIVEAYSVGTPVLGSNMGNVGDLIKDRYTGLKYDSKNPMDIVDAIIESQNIEFAMVESYYRENYTKERNYAQLQAVYHSVTYK